VSDIYHNRHKAKVFDYPLAYHISFHCYGTRLPGDPDGSVRKQQNLPGTLSIPHSPSRMRSNKKRMNQQPYSLNEKERAIVVSAIREVCDFRRWELIAAHVRSTHVHIVVFAACKPEKVLNDFKTYATRALRREGLISEDQKVWSRHGSTRYKWSDDDVASAVEYVVFQQGEMMEVFQRC